MPLPIEMCAFRIILKITAPNKHWNSFYLCFLSLIFGWSWISTVESHTAAKISTDQKVVLASLVAGFIKSAPGLHQIVTHSNTKVWHGTNAAKLQYYRLEPMPRLDHEKVQNWKQFCIAMVAILSLSKLLVKQTAVESFNIGQGVNVNVGM